MKSNGEVSQKTKSQKEGQGRYVVASLVAKDTASQTEDAQRITKWSKHSWARVRGKNS